MDGRFISEISWRIDGATSNPGPWTDSNQREIGIRTALGADRATVARLFFRGGLRLSVIGLILSLPLSVLTLHVLTVQSQVPPTNLFVVSAIVAAAVIIVASAASWLPARAAARVDPFQALRLD